MEAGGGVEVVQNTAASAAQGAGTGTVSLLADHGVTAVISGRFGPKAYQGLQAAGIEMYVTLVDKDAAGALDRFRAGELKRFEVKTY